MAKPKKKALPRRERVYPQSARCFSTNFMDQLLSHDSKTFVPMEDYRKLERRYLRLFNRLQRVRKARNNKESDDPAPNKNMFTHLVVDSIKAVVAGVAGAFRLAISLSFVFVIVFITLLVFDEDFWTVIRYIFM